MFIRTICAIFLGMFVFSCCFSQEIRKVGHLEITSYEDSLVLAKDQNKKVLILFVADYCGWCHKQKEVFVDPDVSENLQDYVICYVDSSVRRDLSSKYKVRTIPTYFVIDKEENIIKKNIGYKDKLEFIKWLQK